MLIILFAIQNSIVLPLTIAFKEELSDLQIIGVLSNLTTVLFFMDIVIGFFTSYINVSSGDEIFGMRMIARNYVCKGTFLIDILSTFDLDDLVRGIGNESLTFLMSLFGFLKMQRIRRINKIIGNLNTTQETKAFLKVAKMVFLLILYIHILACILWLVLSRDKVWIPEADFIYAETKLFHEHFGKQYLSMCYHAIMVFGINEVAPVMETEVIVIIVIMVVSAMVNAYIFGEMAVLVQEMDKKDIEFQESLDNANTAMHSLEIPEKI